MLGAMYAAPFLLLAAALFASLAAFPRTRRFAIMAPSGVIAFGPTSLIGYLAIGAIREKMFGNSGPADRWDFVAYLLSGLIATLLTVIVLRIILGFLPAMLLKLIVLGGAFCSYFLLIIAICIGVNFIVRDQLTRHSMISGIFMVCIAALAGVTGSAWISQKSNEFRFSGPALIDG